jgi:hypothetical protein
LPDERPAAGDPERVVHYRAYVQTTLEGGPLDDPPDDVRRILCGFCGDMTKLDPANEVAYLSGTLVDGSRWVGLGAHVRCLTAAVHPPLAESVAKRLGHE